MNTTILALSNQKGGVGKTTTTVNLGVGLARQGKKVLLVDCDPQASLTISLGHSQPDALPCTQSPVLYRVRYSLKESKSSAGQSIYYQAHDSGGCTHKQTQTTSCQQVYVSDKE